MGNVSWSGTRRASQLAKTGVCQLRPGGNPHGRASAIVVKEEVQSAPPPAARYDEFLAQWKRDHRTASIKFDGARLRRAVILRRRHDTWAFIRKNTTVALETWWDRLPEELR